MRGGIHNIHISQRKREHQKREQFPHPNLWIRALDRITLAVGIVGPLMNIPQFVKILELQNAESISMLSWVLYGVFDIPFIIYGIVHKEKPIIVTYSLWFLTNVAIVIAVIIYS